jgi:hypothetical protein
MADKISETFGVAPVKYAPLPVPHGGNEEVKSDAVIARANLKGLMETATEALEGALELARQSDSPRAFEVLATLISTAAELNTKLLDIHANEQKISKGNPQEEATVTNNNVFVGTTSELHEMIMNKRRQNETVRN